MELPPPAGPTTSPKDYAGQAAVWPKVLNEAEERKLDADSFDYCSGQVTQINTVFKGRNDLKKPGKDDPFYDLLAGLNGRWTKR